MTPLLHSIIVGEEGLPLVILHGFLGMCDNWKTLGIAYSQKGLRVHLLDQRNHGKSFHSELFSYEAMSRDLVNYLDHHNIEKAIVMGHSMGGKTAMFTSVNYPNRVDKLIIVDIAPRYYPPHHQDILEGMLALNQSNVKTRNEADIFLKGYVEESRVRLFLLKNLYRKSTGDFALRLNINVLRQKEKYIGEALPKNAMFSGDTLFLKGGNSEYISDTDRKQIKIHFQKSKIKTIENTGHWIHSENPKSFLKETESFIFGKQIHFS